MKFIKYIFLSLFICHAFFINSLVPGSFQSVPGSPYVAGAHPSSIAFSPLVSAGKVFAAVVNFSDNTLIVYKVDPFSGIFTPIEFLSTGSGSGPISVAFSPEVSGNLFAAIANEGNNTLSVYQVNTTSGAFSQIIQPSIILDIPVSVAFSPEVSGNLFAAVVNSGNNTLSVFQVNPNTGVFTELIEPPFTTLNVPVSVAFSSEVSGNLFAAVANQNSDTVSVYQVNTRTGAFLEVIGSPFATGLEPSSVAFSPEVLGTLLAAVTNDLSNTVTGYNVTLPPSGPVIGTLTPISNFPTGGSPVSVAFSLEVSGSMFAAVANLGDGTVTVYNVNINPCSTNIGEFTQVDVVSTGSGSSPTSIAYSPVISGNLFAAVANLTNNTVSVYKVVLPPPSEPPPPDSSSIVKSPRHCKGFQKIHYDSPIDYVNVLKWKAPLKGSTVVEYRIYRKNFLNLVGVIKNLKPLKFKDHRNKGKTSIYYIVSIDEFNNTSDPVKIKVRGKRK